jgi:hypothetical protein
MVRESTSEKTDKSESRNKKKIKVMLSLLLTNSAISKNHSWQTKIMIILEKSIPAGRVIN